MVDYSKLQIEIVKNCCKGKTINNRYCFCNDKVLITDSDNTLLVAIPREKFIINVKKDCIRPFETPGLSSLIDKDVKQLYDTGIDKFIKSQLTVHLFKYNNKEFYVDSKKLKLLGYDPSIYIVKVNINKKYQPLQFYIDDKLVGVICQVIEPKP